MQQGASSKRTGHILPAEYEEDAYLSQLDPVVSQLQQDVPDAKYDRKSLANLIMQLRKFMEEVMGRNGVMKAFPKLPARLFSDFRPDGPLTVIAAKLHQLRKARDIKRIEFGNIGMRRQVVDMLNQVRKELERLRLLVPPVVHVHASVGEQAPKLKATVTKMGGQLADSPDDPAVTHIVYPFGPKGDPDDGQEYMRVLAFKGDNALVHWWYLPDSYDERLPRDVAAHRLEPDKQIMGPWKVYLRWLIDSERFNEWMNPIDYETEEAVEEQEALAKANGTWQAPDDGPGGGGGGDGGAGMAIPTVAEVLARAAAATAHIPKPAFALPTIPKPGSQADAAAKQKQSEPVAAAVPGGDVAMTAAEGAAVPAAASTEGAGPAGTATPAASQPAAPAAAAAVVEPPGAGSLDAGVPAADAGAAATPAVQSQGGAAPLPTAAAGAAAETAAPAAAAGSATAAVPGVAVPLPTSAAQPAAAAPVQAQAPARPTQAVQATPVAPTVAAASKLTRPGIGAAFGAPSNKKLRADHEIVEVEPGPGTRVTPAAVRHVSVEVHRSVTDGTATVENLSQGQQLAALGALQGQPPRAPFPTIQPPLPAAAGMPQPSTHLTSQLRSSLHASDPKRHYVPYYSAWFRWDDIHEIEEAALPEFFTGKYPSRTPERYMMYRNSIIQLYRQQPSRRITSTDARRNVVGDVDSIHGTWEFLDKWGLINFQALDEASLAFAHVVAGSSTQAPAAAGAGAVERQGATAGGQAGAQTMGQLGLLLNLKQVTHAEALQAATVGGSSQSHIVSTSRRAQAGAHRAVAEAAAAASRSSGAPPLIMCSAMPWVDCTQHRYHCLKYPAVNLCSAAYAEGRFPPGCSAKDFVRIDRKTLSEATDESGWSACETLLLLEGLELYGEQWDKITEHVGTKTQVQCLMHFLALPIEDAALDELEQGWGSATMAARQQQVPGATAVAGLTAAPPQADVPPAAQFRPPGPLLPPPHAPAVALPAPPLPATATNHTSTDGPQGMDLDDGNGDNGDRKLSGAGGLGQRDGPEVLVPGGLVGDAPDGSVIDAAVAAQLVPCFSEAPNPVMAQAAVLSVLLGPKLAAEYAGTAIAELSHQVLPPPPEGEGDMDDMEPDGEAALQAPLSGPALQRAVHAAHTAGMVAVAARARVMAEQEEREMYRLVNQLVALQSQKVDIKLKHLADLDQALDNEALNLETQRDACMAERRQLREKRRDPAACPTPASLPNGLAPGLPHGSSGGAGQPGQHPAAANMQLPAGTAGVPGLLQQQSGLFGQGVNAHAPGVDPQSVQHPGLDSAIQALASLAAGSQQGMPAGGAGAGPVPGGAQTGLVGGQPGQTAQASEQQTPNAGGDQPSSMIIDLT